MAFKGLTDEQIHKGLEKKVGVARPGYKELFFDALSMAPAFLGLPMGIGTPKPPKKSAPINIADFLKKKKTKAKAKVAKPKFKPGDQVQVRGRMILDQEHYGVNSMVMDGWIEKLETLSKSAFGRDDPISDIKILKKTILQHHGKKALSKFNQAINTLEPHDWPYALNYMYRAMGYAGEDALFIESSIKKRLSPADKQKLDMTKEWLSDLYREPIDNTVPPLRTTPWGEDWDQALTERRNILQEYKNQPLKGAGKPSKYRIKRSDWEDDFGSGEKAGIIQGYYPKIEEWKDVTGRTVSSGRDPSRPYRLTETAWEAAERKLSEFEGALKGTVTKLPQKEPSAVKKLRNFLKEDK